MPQFNGKSAMEIVKKRDLDLPFIFVSGTLGKDVAIQAMKAGAHDYVMKGNLARLVPATQRELGEAKVRRQRRQAEEEMRASEYKYRRLFESLGDAAFLIEMEPGRIVDANPQAEALLGRARAEILDLREDQLFPPPSESAGLPTGAQGEVWSRMSCERMGQSSRSMFRHPGLIFAVARFCWRFFVT
jgi:PAS domain-containing protein